LRHIKIYKSEKYISTDEVLGLTTNEDGSPESELLREERRRQLFAATGHTHSMIFVDQYEIFIPRHHIRHCGPDPQSPLPSHLHAGGRNAGGKMPPLQES